MRALWLILGFLPTMVCAAELTRTAIPSKQPMTVIIETDDVKKLVNRVLELRIKFESNDQQKTDVELLSFDARMPEHRHGMMVKPTVAKVSKNLYTVQGVKFHMRGAWEMQLKFKALGVEETVKIPLSLR